MLDMLLAAAGAPRSVYVEDVFSTDEYTGNGGIQRVYTGVGLAESPVNDVCSSIAYTGTGAQMVINDLIDRRQPTLDIFKGRSGATAWAFYDTVRGVGYDLDTSTAAQTSQSTGVTGYVNPPHGGVQFGTLAKINTSGATYIKHTFRKAAKFFDIVSWAGTGGAQTLNHGLGVKPGLILVKNLTTAAPWEVYHITLGAGNAMQLNSNGASQMVATAIWNATEPTATQFTVGGGLSMNTTGNNYIAYLFAHDPSSTGMVYCDSYVGNGSTSGPLVNGMNWQPQLLWIKASSAAGSWMVFDNQRGINSSATADPALTMESSAAEITATDYLVSLSQSGFQPVTTDANVNANGVTYVYMAIRMPQPTAGGGMLMLKGRSGATDWGIYDTDRWVNLDKTGTSSAAETLQPQGVRQFNRTSFDVGNLAKLNTSGATYAAYTFKQHPRFFQKIVYTGDGYADKFIPTQLAGLPGLAICKAVGSTGDWYVQPLWMQQQNILQYLTLDSTAAGTAMSSGPTAISMVQGGLYVHNNGSGVVPWVLNTAGVIYELYLFYHDTAPDGIIQCGSFATDVSGNATVSLPWEPQFVLYKAVSTTSNWAVLDTLRGMSLTQNALLCANTTAAEGATTGYIQPAAQGFTASGLTASTTYTFMAIRKGPMRVPTQGRQVFNTVLYTATNVAARQLTGAGFPPDMVWFHARSSALNVFNYDKLRGPNRPMYLNANTAEQTGTDTGSPLEGTFLPDGVVGGITGTAQMNYSTYNDVLWLFRSAPGFYERTAYTVPSNVGNSFTIPHNLGVAPNIVLIKRRDTTGNWPITIYGSNGINGALQLNTNVASSSNNAFLWSQPDSKNVTIMSGGADTGAANGKYIMHVFAELPGVSKIGGYTGNGLTQNIDCGFAGGPNFILIKRLDAAGDWYVWDGDRGIVPGGSDPYVLLDSSAAENSTADSVDLTSTGFTVKYNSVTNINVNGATYIFLAIAY